MGIGSASRKSFVSTSSRGRSSKLVVTAASGEHCPVDSCSLLRRMVLASEKDAYSDLLKEIDSSYDVGRVSADVRLVPFEENDEPGVPASEVPMSKALRSKSLSLIHI